MATEKEIDAIKRRLAKQALEEVAARPDWKHLAKKSNKGMKKSQSKKAKTDIFALGSRLPGAGWSNTG